MSEERLQEIKDSIEFQYTLAKAKGYDNALLFTNEEEELVEEIERLNKIIKDIKSQLDYLETYSSKEDVFEDMKRRLDRIDKIIGSYKGINNE